VKALRPYQVEMLAAVGGSPGRRQLVQAATGTGKTVTFAAMPEWPAIRARLDRFGAWSMLVIAHREELIDQAADKLAAQNPHAVVSVEQGDRYASPLATIVVASIQTLAARGGARLARLMARHAFRLVVVDEAHHAAASTYRAALTQLGFLPADLATDDVEELQSALVAWDRTAPRDRLLVGVTATPNRSDAVGLGCVFESMVYSYPLRQAIVDGWLVPIVAWSIETRANLDAVKTTAGDFNQKQLAEAVDNTARNRLAVSAWLEHAEGLQTLAFTVDVKHAHAVAAAFETAGVSAAAVSGETPKLERRQMLEAYTDGRITVLANCMILTEGTDLPATGCILHLKPTKSATLYEQMTGRGLRLFDGKDACVVIDLVDIARKHSLQTAPVLFGLPPALVTNGRNLEELKQRYDEFTEKYPGLTLSAGRKTLEQLEAMARQVDVWNLPSMGALANGLTCRWLRMAEDAFRLRYPWQQMMESVDVAPDLVGQWVVTASWRAMEAGQTVPAPVTVARGLMSPREALQAAEDYVRTSRGSALRLKAQAAPWMGRPASAKQVELLRKWGAPIKRGLTAGEASEMIDHRMSRIRH
jgi:ATP-dependent helicase IRC3